MKITNTMKEPYNNVVNIIGYIGRDQDGTENSESVFDAHHVTGKSKSCTGTLLSPTVVLTAGHCLYSFDNYDGKTEAHQRGDFFVMPARNEGDMNNWNNPDFKEHPSHYPRGVYETTNMWYDARWKNGQDSYASHNYDWGILFLKTPVKNFSNEFTYGKYDNDDLKSLFVASYPMQTPERPNADYFDFSMWLSHGKYIGMYNSFKGGIVDYYQNMMVVDNDLMPGSSGGAAYSKYNNKIIGVVSMQDLANNGYPLNIICIIDDELNNLINKAVS